VVISVVFTVKNLVWFCLYFAKKTVVYFYYHFTFLKTLQKSCFLSFEHFCETTRDSCADFGKILHIKFQSLCKNHHLWPTLLFLHTTAYMLSALYAIARLSICPSHGGSAKNG